MNEIELTLIKQSYQGIHDHMIPMLLKTPEPQLRKRIVPTINPIIWQAWHILRTEDMYYHTVMFDQEQLFHREQWRGKLQTNTNHIGTGMTIDEADELSQHVSLEGLSQYNEAIRKAIFVLLDHPPLPIDVPLDDASTLDERLSSSDSFPEGTRQNRANAYALRERSNGLIGLISHAYMHIGQFFAVTKPL